jgi:hypothetical protein
VNVPQRVTTMAFSCLGMLDSPEVVSEVAWQLVQAGLRHGLRLEGVLLRKDKVLVELGWPEGVEGMTAEKHAAATSGVLIEAIRVGIQRGYLRAEVLLDRVVGG